MVYVYRRVYEYAFDKDYYMGYESDDEYVVEVEVSRLDENAGKWVELENLDDIVLFVGDCCSFSAPAKEIFYESSYFYEGNVIFFTEEVHGVEVFVLGFGSCPDDSCDEIWPPPDWVYSATPPTDHVSSISLFTIY